MKHTTAILLALLVGTALNAAESISEGSATGELFVGGEKTPLRFSWVIERDGSVELWLASRLLPSGTLASSTSIPADVSVVVIQLDEGRQAARASAWHLGLPRGSSATGALRLNASVSTPSRLTGVVLLEAGADPWSFDARFDAPVSRIQPETARRAPTMTREQLVARIEDRGYDVTANSLLAAIMDDEPPELVQMFLDAGISANTESALGIAVDHGSEEIVRMLVDAGARVDAPARPHEALMMRAADKGNAAVAKLLLDAGAEMNVKSEYGVTPVGLAAENGHVEVVRLLVEAGADLNVRSEEYGNMAVLAAVTAGNREIVRLLLDGGADVKRDADKLSQYTDDPEIRRMIAEAAARQSSAPGQ